MSCNPNVKTIVSPETTDVQGFAVDNQAVLVTAYGLTDEDTITFKRVDYCSSKPNYERIGCSIITPSKADIASAITYQIGECAPMLSPRRASLVIYRSGAYIPILDVASGHDVTVTVEPINGTEFSDKELGVVPCGFCLDKTWETTGGMRCNQHFVELEEISNCGNLRWRRTERRCDYYASVPLPITLDDGDCCGSVFTGYLFHPDETRDPDATVEITDCDGVLHGYAYPTAGDGHTLPIQQCNGEIVGYAVNNSAVAPQQTMGC